MINDISGLILIKGFSLRVKLNVIKQMCDKMVLKVDKLTSALNPRFFSDTYQSDQSEVCYKILTFAFLTWPLNQTAFPFWHWKHSLVRIPAKYQPEILVPTNKICNDL